MLKEINAITGYYRSLHLVGSCKTHSQQTQSRPHLSVDSADKTASWSNLKSVTLLQELRWSLWGFASKPSLQPAGCDGLSHPGWFCTRTSSKAFFLSPNFCLLSPSQLLCTVMADISARVLPTSSPDDQPLLSPRHYQHTDRDTGTQLVCDKCPAGTYVSAHCSPTAERDCSPCPKGTFTRGENGVQQCHRCKDPCPAGFIEKAPCTATQDRICACPPNTFLSGDGGAVCKPHSLCPPGKRVKKQGSEKKDVVCKPCAEGTFSDVESNATQCRNHTDCQAHGLVLLTPGTREKDNVCGPPHTGPSSASVTTAGGQAQAVLVQEPIISPVFPAPLAGPALKGEEWGFCFISSWPCRFSVITVVVASGLWVQSPFSSSRVLSHDFNAVNVLFEFI